MHSKIDTNDTVQRLSRQQVKIAARLTAVQQVSDQLARARLAWFFLALLVAAVVFLRWGAVPWAVTLLAAAVPFVVLVAWHRRVETAVQRLRVWHAIKGEHLSRLQLRWPDLPAPAPVPSRFDHPFALDLDLIGERSLQHLLDTAVSAEGSARLRRWLLTETPDMAAIHPRQRLVAELRRRPLFRDKLTLNARLVAGKNQERWPGKNIVEWLQQHPAPPLLTPITWLLSLLALANIGLFFLWQVGFVGQQVIWFYFIYVGVYVWHWGKIGDIFRDVVFLDESLQRLNGIFSFLERWPYGGTPELRQLCHSLLAPETRPSTEIRQLRRVVAFVGLRQNPFVALLLNLVVPWDMWAAGLLTRRKKALQAHLPRWLDVWYELEALSSLATFAALHPTHKFPAISVDSEVVFHACELGHPLLPDDEKVRNDFEMPEMGRVAIITGSNMSGKSTFLRTVGVNLALAFAGSVIDASALTARPLRLFSSIRVTDSVTDGFSFFYAEVRRLQQLLAELQKDTAVPLFYFVDEIFRGTNNRERLLGSREYVRAVAGENGVGLVATHDLELVKLADEMTAVSNYHFRDDVVDGQMVFDYQLHLGPCPTTNALKIMAQAGLPVPEMELI